MDRYTNNIIERFANILPSEAERHPHSTNRWLYKVDDLTKRIHLKALDCAMIGDNYQRYDYPRLQADYHAINELLMTQPDIDFDILRKTSTLFVEVFIEVSNGLKNMTDKRSRVHFIFRGLIATFETDYFTRRLKEMYALHDSNQSSLIEYIEDLRSAYPKLMVIRLDLYCDRAFCDEVHIPGYWEDLLANVRMKFLSYAGYAVKFEFGVDRGVHLHTLLFFNGDVARLDVVIAKAVGRIWVSMLPPDAGSFHNANDPHYLKTIKNVAVGTIYGASEIFDKGIRTISAYITKPDPIVLLVLPQLDRTFRRGYLTKEQKLRVLRRRKATLAPASLLLRQA